MAGYIQLTVKIYRCAAIDCFSHSALGRAALLAARALVVYAVVTIAGYCDLSLSKEPTCSHLAQALASRHVNNQLHTVQMQHVKTRSEPVSRTMLSV